MSETYLGTIALIGLIITAIGSWFYMWGGRSGKWKRRFVGSLICASSIWIESLMLGIFQFIMVLIYPLYVGFFIMGYGSDILLTKIIKRSIIVLASLSVGLGFCLLFEGNCWLIFPLQGLIALGSIWLGIKNPVQAPVEEFFICLLLTEINMLYPFAIKIGFLGG